MSINRVIVSGNLTREPEVPATASATAVDPMTSTLYDDDIAF